MIVLLTTCLFFWKPCARAKLHQQKRARKLCLATLKYRFIKLDLVTVGKCYFHFSRVLGSVVDCIRVNTSMCVALKTFLCDAQNMCAITKVGTVLKLALLESENRFTSFYPGITLSIFYPGITPSWWQGLQSFKTRKKERSEAIMYIV